MSHQPTCKKLSPARRIARHSLLCSFLLLVVHPASAQQRTAGTTPGTTTGVHTEASFDAAVVDEAISEFGTTFLEHYLLSESDEVSCARDCKTGRCIFGRGGKEVSAEVCIPNRANKGCDDACKAFCKGQNGGAAVVGDSYYTIGSEYCGGLTQICLFPPTNFFPPQAPAGVCAGITDLDDMFDRCGKLDNDAPCMPYQDFVVKYGYTCGPKNFWPGAPHVCREPLPRCVKADDREYDLNTEDGIAGLVVQLQLSCRLPGIWDRGISIDTALPPGGDQCVLVTVDHCSVQGGQGHTFRICRDTTDTKGLCIKDSACPSEPGKPRACEKITKLEPEGCTLLGNANDPRNAGKPVCTNVSYTCSNTPPGSVNGGSPTFRYCGPRLAEMKPK